MQIQTKRLLLTPFTADIIRAASEGCAEKYAALGIVPTDEWPEPDLVEALPHFRRLLAGHGVTGCNSWLILDERTREIVGSLGFLGEPDADGTLELGFGIIPGRRRNGYCEEAVRALTEWARSQKGVQRITAHCDADNLASRQLLVKAGFKETGKDQDLLRWELAFGRGPQ